jgi:hypothetical protein
MPTDQTGSITAAEFATTLMLNRPDQPQHNVTH